MSVLLPWKRNVKTGARSQSLKRPLSHANAPRPRAGVLHRILIAVGLALAVFATGNAVYDSIFANPLRRAKKLWDAGDLVAFSGVYALLKEQTGLVFMGPSGKIGEMPGVTEAVISGERVFALDGQSLAALGADGRISTLCRSKPGERLLRCSDFDGALLVRPGAEGTFGEPWFVRAISPLGEVLCDASLPGIPALAGVYGRTLLVGLRDVAAGGRPGIACVDLSHGKVSWTRMLAGGHWRGIVADPSGRTAYVTSSAAGLLESSGCEMWSDTTLGPARALAYAQGVLILSHEVSGKPFLSALSEDGRILWRNPTPSPAHALATDGTSLVALCQTHVIGFSLKDGDITFSLATRDLPLAVGDDVLLLRKASGAYLVTLDISQARPR